MDTVEKAAIKACETTGSQDIPFENENKKASLQLVEFPLKDWDESALMSIGELEMLDICI